MKGLFSTRFVAVVLVATVAGAFTAKWFVTNAHTVTTTTTHSRPIAAPTPAPFGQSVQPVDRPAIDIRTENEPENDAQPVAADARFSRTAATRTLTPAVPPAHFAVSSGGATVLKTANSFKNGGGFNWDSGTGCPDEIHFKGVRILSKAKGGTYCCGYTFAVVMRAAQENGLLEDKSVRQIRRFQQHWYAATPEAKEKMQVYALQFLGVGKEVPLLKAEPGDFVRLWHGHSGHSVILVRWIVENGRRVGFEYRGTQGTTDGIGNRIEYIEGTPGHENDPSFILERTYAGRLNAKPH